MQERYYRNPCNSNFSWMLVNLSESIPGFLGKTSLRYGWNMIQVGSAGNKDIAPPTFIGDTFITEQQREEIASTFNSLPDVYRNMTIYMQCNNSSYSSSHSPANLLVNFGQFGRMVTVLIPRADIILSFMLCSFEPTVIQSVKNNITPVSLVILQTLRAISKYCIDAKLKVGVNITTHVVAPAIDVTGVQDDIRRLDIFAETADSSLARATICINACLAAGFNVSLLCNEAIEKTVNTIGDYIKWRSNIPTLLYVDKVLGRDDKFNELYYMTLLFSLYKPANSPGDQRLFSNAIMRSTKPLTVCDLSDGMVLYNPGMDLIRLFEISNHAVSWQPEIEIFQFISNICRVCPVKSAASATSIMQEEFRELQYTLNNRMTKITERSLNRNPASEVVSGAEFKQRRIEALSTEIAQYKSDNEELVLRITNNISRLRELERCREAAEKMPEKAISLKSIGVKHVQIVSKTDQLNEYVNNTMGIQLDLPYIYISTNPVAYFGVNPPVFLGSFDVVLPLNAVHHHMRPHEIFERTFIANTLFHTTSAGYTRHSGLHPHLFGYSNRVGVPCFGEIEYKVIAGMEEENLIGLSRLMVDFLQSVNMEDPAGKYIVHYPIIAKDGNGDPVLVVETNDMPVFYKYFTDRSENTEDREVFKSTVMVNGKPDISGTNNGIANMLGWSPVYRGGLKNLRTIEDVIALPHDSCSKFTANVKETGYEVTTHDNYVLHPIFGEIKIVSFRKRFSEFKINERCSELADIEIAEPCSFDVNDAAMRPSRSVTEMARQNITPHNIRATLRNNNASGFRYLGSQICFNVAERATMSGFVGSPLCEMVKDNAKLSQTLAAAFMLDNHIVRGSINIYVIEPDNTEIVFPPEPRLDVKELKDMLCLSYGYVPSPGSELYNMFDPPHRQTALYALKRSFLVHFMLPSSRAAAFNLFTTFTYSAANLVYCITTDFVPGEIPAEGVVHPSKSLRYVGDGIIDHSMDIFDRICDRWKLLQRFGANATQADAIMSRLTQDMASDTEHPPHIYWEMRLTAAAFNMDVATLITIIFRGGHITEFEELNILSALDNYLPWLNAFDLFCIVGAIMTDCKYNYGNSCEITNFMQDHLYDLAETLSYELDQISPRITEQKRRWFGYLYTTVKDCVAVRDTIASVDSASMVENVEVTPNQDVTSSVDVMVEETGCHPAFIDIVRIATDVDEEDGEDADEEDDETEDSINY